MGILTEEDYPALKIEFNTDPKGLGYASMSDLEVANILNEVGASSEEIFKSEVDGQDAVLCVDIGEYKSLTAAERDAWVTIVAAGDGKIRVGDSRARNQVLAIWTGDKPITRAALADLAKRSATRAEVVFGRDTIVYYWDVARAKALS